MIYDDPERFARSTRELLVSTYQLVAREYTKEERDPVTSAHVRRVLVKLDFEDDRYVVQLDYECNLENREVPMPIVRVEGMISDLQEELTWPESLAPNLAVAADRLLRLASAPGKYREELDWLRSVLTEIEGHAELLSRESGA